MSFRILFIDELRGFYKSKIMLILWFGLPGLTLLMHFINPDLEGMPLSFLVSLLISSIGGTLSAAIISTSIASEKSHHVYDLILVRPVKRYSILLSKYLAVIFCLIIAVAISLILGLVVDFYTLGPLTSAEIKGTFEALATSISGLSIACSIGLFFGIIISSVPVAAIISVYLGNQLSAISILTSMFITWINPLILAIIIGGSITVIFLGIAIITFNKKSLQ